MRRSLEGSLRRLRTDYIDLYQLHVDVAPEHAPVVIDALEGLVAAGLIRTYGCSVDEPAAAQAFTGGPHCAAVQFDLNVLQDNPAMLAVCESAGLAAICRTVLAEGLLTGKYGPESTFPPDDMRHRGLSWMIYFRGGRPDPHFLAQVHALREILTSNGRTMAQGALAWALARSPQAIPIPGFKSVQHVAEHAQALQLGPLTSAQMEEVDRVLARTQGQGG
jgi:aryl-alcohol dehydrogenase-like predicted oxidoreductase